MPVNDDRGNAGSVESPVIHWVSQAGSGHQSAYDEVLRPLIESHGFAVSDNRNKAAIAVFHATLDFNYWALLLSALRSIFGGPQTVALFLRPQNCLRPKKPSHWIKKILFKMMRRAPGISILTILPFSIEPRLAEYADDWINDPQLWDLELCAPLVLKQPSRALAGQKPQIALLGSLDRNKGFDQFASMWIGEAAIREKFQFVAAGSLEASLGSLGDAFVAAGGILINQRISDARMFELFHDSFAVWCAYDREYDQASGIFGRAFQLGIPAIVTGHSFLERQSKALGHEHVALSPDWTDYSHTSARLLLEWSPTRPVAAERRATVSGLRERDIARLVSILRPGAI